MRALPSIKPVLLASFVALSITTAVSALAAPPRQGPMAAPKPKDDAAAAGHKAFREAIQDGSDKYEARDVLGAIEAFRRATELEPRNPVGYFYLGQAEVGNKDLPQAESAFLHASQVSDEGTPAVKAKIFFVIADLRERQRRWEDAKASWEQYGDVCAKLFGQDSLYPQVAKERIASIDRMLEQDKAYVIVRKRIAEEKAKGGASGH